MVRRDDSEERMVAVLILVIRALVSITIALAGLLTFLLAGTKVGIILKEIVAIQAAALK